MKQAIWQVEPDVLQEHLVCGTVLKNKGTIKVEAIHGERFAIREEMRQTVFEYIEVDYNRTSRQSANGYISPEAFEAQRVT
jgi:transposase InsO family protein